MVRKPKEPSGVPPRSALRPSRRGIRELVLITLFQLEFRPNRELDLSQVLISTMKGLHESEETDTSERLPELPERYVRFALELLVGVRSKIQEIDDVLQSFSHVWTISRIARLERTILRIALYELIWITDIPPAATLDEAIELTKIYCAPEATSFVNGILGNIYNHLEVLRQRGEAAI